jgi:hypothetical protein
MSGIGGLDVSYGARHQIVRTNVAVFKTDTTAPTEAQMKSIADLLDQGLSHTMLAPDFVVAMSAADTPTLATTSFQVDSTGNGAVDSTFVSKGGLLRDARQTPLARGSSTGASAELPAIGTLLSDQAATSTSLATVQSGNLVLEAVLNVGAALLSGTVGTATSGISAFNLGEENAGGTEGIDGTPTDTEAIAEFTIGANSPSGVYSAALASAVSQMDAAADYKVAGHPEGQVGLLNLGGVANAMLDDLTSTDPSEGTLATVLSNHSTSGRAQAGSEVANAATFTNLLAAADTGSATFGAATGIMSCVSIAKVL